MMTFDFTDYINGKDYSGVSVSVTKKSEIVFYADGNHILSFSIRDSLIAAYLINEAASVEIAELKSVLDDPTYGQ